MMLAPYIGNLAHAIGSSTMLTNMEAVRNVVPDAVNASIARHARPAVQTTY